MGRWQLCVEAKAAQGCSLPADRGLGMLLPQQHGGIRALAAGEWSCTQPLAEGSRKQEEEGNGVRRRDEVWV